MRSLEKVSFIYLSHVTVFWVANCELLLETYDTDLCEQEVKNVLKDLQTPLSVNYLEGNEHISKFSQSFTDYRRTCYTT